MASTQESPVEAARLEELRAAGAGWPAERAEPRGSGSVSSDLVIRSEVTGSHPGDRYVRFQRAGGSAFRGAGPGAVRATTAVLEPHGPLGRLVMAAKRRVVGNPLANERASHERLTKLKALAVLSSDAISSVAYATGAMLSVLLVAGTGTFGASLWIGACIALLFAIVVLSYRQTIKAYPRGGGSYIVASDNLGSIAGLVAGSSLMIDYVLTVAVSITQGVANLVSLAPGIAPYTLAIDVAFIVLLLLGNLRGIRESGTIFMLPSYAFVLFVYLMIVVGAIHFLANGGHVLSPQYLPGVTPLKATETLSLFLILRAFAGGCTALTGVEAISDGVPAFQPPEWRNARTTLTTLGVLAITMFAGITLLVHVYGLVPNAGDNVPTLISQLNSATLGNGIGFYYGQIVTALILLLAANTAYSDFPRLAFFMARDGFLPHQFTHRGDRLSYSNGILILTAIATLLIVRYWSDTSQLLNLYVIGVFASFTLSQSGMVRRWWTRREQGWRKGMWINGTGAGVTAIVLAITAFTKFTSGAWLVVVLVPLMVATFLRINAHYRQSRDALRPRALTPPSQMRHTVIAAAHGQGTDDPARAFAASVHAERLIMLEPPQRPPGTRQDKPPQWADRAPTAGGTTAVEVSIVAASPDLRRALLSTLAALPASVSGQRITVVLDSPATARERLARWSLRRRLLRRYNAAVVELAPRMDLAAVRTRRTTLVSVAVLNIAGLEALAYAWSLFSGRVLAIHVATDEDRARARQEWDAWGNHVPLITIDSPYRAIVGPLRAYVDALAEQDPGQVVTVVLPQVIAHGLLGRVLHNHTANRLRRLLLKRPNTAVVDVPYRLP